MSVFDTSSFNDESSPDLATGSTVELDEAEIEAQTRRLLGLADEAPLDDEGFTAPQPPATLNPEGEPQTRGEGEAPSEAVPPSPPAASDDDLEPRLAAPSDAAIDDESGGENFVIVDPEVDDLPVPTDGIPSDAPDTHAEGRGGEYDWNTYIGTLFSNVPDEARQAAVVNVFSTWDDLNRLPGHYQQAINAMLDGSFDPARFFPQTAPATPPAPTLPAGSDPWSDDPTPAVVADPRIDQLEQQLTQVQLTEARRIQADIESGAAQAFDEFTRSHPELTREEIDAIALSVNRASDYIYSRYSQGVSSRDVWLEVADNMVWQSPELRRKVAEAELAKERQPVQQAIAQANQRAANAAKVAGGGVAPKSPLERGGAKQSPAVGPDGKPLKDLDLTRAIADQLKGSPKVVVEANPDDAPPRSALTR